MAYISHSVTTEVDASLFCCRGRRFLSERLTKGSPMDGIPQTTLPDQATAAIVRTTERLQGAASLLAMLEDKADDRQITAAELAVVRCIVEACAADLDRAWEKA